MKRCTSPCRRVRLSAAKFARSTIIGIALLGATGLEMTASGTVSELHAQDIISSATASGNNASKTFSNTSGSAFDSRPVVGVKLPGPTKNATVVDSGQYKFTFFFPENADANEVVAIDLLCSNDKGKTWRDCATKLPNDANKDFLFQAPEPGEYWFVLMTSFQAGENSFSSTKGLIFTEGANAVESFALADDEEPTLDGDPNSLTELSNLAAPPILRQGDEELLVDNASFAAEDAQPELTTPTAPELDAPELQDMQAPPEETTPRPGKLRNLSFGVGKGSGSLLVTVRWFRPEDLDAKYDVGVKSLSVERAPSPSGPWTIIAEDLDVTQAGYSWTATAEEMKPFYVRTVARDSQGNVWRDVTSSPMDVNQPAVRSALGPVKTPAPFTDAAKSDGAAKESDSGADKTKIIRHTASESDEATDGDDAASSDAEGDAKGAKQNVRLVSTVERSQSKASAPPRERPYIPAPTDPNEFQLNPLFTKGFSVLYQSSQARYEPSAPGKRSIFTPPSRSQRSNYIRPAERRYSQREIAAARIEQERKAYQERLKYNKEHEMDSFEQNPQLMEGRMFYMDSNGQLTTTPPPEMQKALGYGGMSMETQGWTRVDQGAGLQGMTTAAATPDGEPIYMPTNAEAYDASARSGAAIWSNEQYPRASNPGSSPLNNRYSGDANAAPQGTVVPGAGTQTVSPQSSYSPSNYGAAPRYISNASAAPTTSNYAFPPQPSVSY